MERARLYFDVDIWEIEGPEGDDEFGNIMGFLGKNLTPESRAAMIEMAKAAQVKGRERQEAEKKGVLTYEEERAAESTEALKIHHRRIADQLGKARGRKLTPEEFEILKESPKEQEARLRAIFEPEKKAKGGKG